MVHDTEENQQDKTNINALLTPLALSNRLAVSLSTLRYVEKLSLVDISTAAEGTKLPYTKKVIETSTKQRIVYAPSSAIRGMQLKIKECILEGMDPGEHSLAYETGSRLIDSGLLLANSKVIIGLDFKEFFNSIPRKYVIQCLVNEGYPEDTSRIVANICCVKDKYHHVPQGGITSPQIANRVSKLIIDPLITGYLDTLGFEYRYVRYSDNVYVGFSDNVIGSSILKALQAILRDNGWRTHKTRILPYYKKQYLLGMVVNERPSIDRRTLDRFLSAMHNISMASSSVEVLDNISKLADIGVKNSSIKEAISSLAGKVAYFKQIKQGTPYCEKLHQYLVRAISKMENLI